MRRRKRGRSREVSSWNGRWWTWRRRVRWSGLTGLWNGLGWWLRRSRHLSRVRQDGRRATTRGARVHVRRHRTGRRHGCRRWCRSTRTRRVGRRHGLRVRRTRISRVGRRRGRRRWWRLRGWGRLWAGGRARRCTWPRLRRALRCRERRWRARSCVRPLGATEVTVMVLRVRGRGDVVNHRRARLGGVSARRGGGRSRYKLPRLEPLRRCTASMIARRLRQRSACRRRRLGGCRVVYLRGRCSHLGRPSRSRLLRSSGPTCSRRERQRRGVGE